MEVFCFGIGDIFCILSFLLDIRIYIVYKRKERLSHVMSPDSATKAN